MYFETISLISNVSGRFGKGVLMDCRGIGEERRDFWVLEAENMGWVLGGLERDFMGFIVNRKWDENWPGQEVDGDDGEKRNGMK